jgi:hypothetical protein
MVDPADRSLDRESRTEIARMEVTTREGRPLGLRDVMVAPGPGADDALRRRFGNADSTP